MKRWVATVLVIVAVGAAGGLALRMRSGSRGNSVEEDIRRATVERGRLVLSVAATGSIVAKSEARLSFDLPGKVTEVRVEVGDVVQSGAELARLDDTTLALQVRQAEVALAAAQAQLDQLRAGPRQEEVAAAKANLDAAGAGLDGAQANLSELTSGPSETQVSAAEANVRGAEAGLRLAEIQRDQLAEGASAAEIAAAQAQVASARLQHKIAQDAHDQTLRCQTVTLPDGVEREICPALGTIEEQARFNLQAAEEALQAAEAQLNQLLEGPTERQRETGEANVAVAAAQRDAAQAQLDALQAGATTGQLEVAQANVAAFTAQRDAAQAQLDLLLAGTSTHQLAAAQANVDQAEIALEMARTELGKALLIAPLDGIVTGVNVQAGQTAPLNLPAVTLTDVSALQIIVDVDEIDVARIEEGQSVTISVDALPDETIAGRVKRIAPAASQLGGVVVFQVTIVLDQTEAPLRVGMSATASIVTEELQDVLLVPNWAIRIDRDTGKTLVSLARAGTVGETEVELGVRGEDESQVLAGLSEGDVVVAGGAIGLRQLLDVGE